MKKQKALLTAFVVLLLLSIIGFFLHSYLEGRFQSVESFQTFIRSYGAFGPLILILFQAFQVVVPVLPGILGCAAGTIMFGISGGFWYNYIGICLGSIAAYLLAVKLGLEIILMMFPKKQYDRWRQRLVDRRSYGVFLFVATLLPLFPDDFLCYFSGLMRMNAKKFLLIILLGKPWCILAYCIGFGMI